MGPIRPQQADPRDLLMQLMQHLRPAPEPGPMYPFPQPQQNGGEDAPRIYRGPQGAPPMMPTVDPNVPMGQALGLPPNLSDLYRLMQRL